MPALPLRPLARLYNALPVRLQRAALAVTHTRFLVGVVGLGVDPKGRLVLARHRFGTPSWRFLGGMLDRHEDPADSLVREIAEETGLPVTVGPLLAVASGRSWAHVEILYAYLVRDPLPGGSSDELLAVAAFAPDDLPPMRADHRALLDRHAGAAIAWALGVPGP